MSEHCLSCGACCAAFRVSFYWAETDAHPEGHVPSALTEAISPFHVAMIGTNQPTPRCSSLVGVVGQHTHCDIYSLRSSSCKEVTAGDAQCNKARAIHGLLPLSLRNA